MDASTASSNQPNTPNTAGSGSPSQSNLIKIVAIIVVAVLVIVGAIFALMPKSAPTATTTKKEVNALTVYTWWTSGSEAAALSKMVGAFSEQYPDTALVTAPVTGGAGYKLLPLITSLVSSGESPDAFQLHAGYEVQPFFDAGLLSQIDYIWKSEGLEKLVPPVVADMSKFDGHYYGVPVNVHRSNLMWYNKAVLNKYGINPATLTTWDAFFAATDKLKAAGMTAPIQLGESWTAAQVFETIVASQGIDFYQNWINGKVTSATDPKLVASLNTFKKYMSYVNADNKDTTWDAATKRLIKGDSAFNLMGDWANGEFKLVGMKYGADYGAFAAPGTAGAYGLVIDTFQRTKDASHPTNSDRWLKLVVSKAGQDAFNSTKGSISVRNDSDATLYDDYQKTAIADFKGAQNLFPSVAHGSGAPDAFKLALSDIIVGFAADLNVQKAATDITAATTKNSTSYKKVWSLKNN